jgi:hypothetical protein
LGQIEAASFALLAATLSGFATLPGAAAEADSKWVEFRVELIPGVVAQIEVRENKGDPN